MTNATASMCSQSQSSCITNSSTPHFFCFLKKKPSTPYQGASPTAKASSWSPNNPAGAIGDMFKAVESKYAGPPSYPPPQDLLGGTESPTSSEHEAALLGPRPVELPRPKGPPTQMGPLGPPLPKQQIGRAAPAAPPPPWKAPPQPPSPAPQARPPRPTPPQAGAAAVAPPSPFNHEEFLRGGDDSDVAGSDSPSD